MVLPKVVYIKNGHPIINIIRKTYNTASENPSLGFSIKEYGLWCPWGYEGITLAKELTNNQIKFPPDCWTFLVEDEKRWLLAKIKYGI